MALDFLPHTVFLKNLEIQSLFVQYKKLVLCRICHNYLQFITTTRPTPN